MVASHDASDVHTAWMYELAETGLLDGSDEDASEAADDMMARTHKTQAIAVNRTSE
jgi:hypothetical protein